MNNSPELLHKLLYDKTGRKLSYSKDRDFPAWREELRSKLIELIGMPLPPQGKPKIIMEAREETPSFQEICFQFESEPDYFVPCRLLLPKNGEKPFRVMICLQGHTSGMHLSLGRPKYEHDAEEIAGGRDFGVQAVNNGCAALVMEQRGFGLCKASAGAETDCHAMAMQALMLGRTLLGERVYDVSRAIDALSCFPEIDLNRIGCMGNSGGGTTTYYAACLDERIKIAMPSCSVCTYFGSIFSLCHCQCNFIPHILEWFEMEDLAGLIAPRGLIVTAGRLDDIFPIKDTEICFSGISHIYEAAGCGGHCRLVTGEGGHQFYPELAWPVFHEMINKERTRV